MKKGIKMTVASLLAVFTVLGAASTVLAKSSSCLDVRDYGYHRYNQRSYDTYKFAHQYSTQAYYKIKDYGQGHYLSQAKKDITIVYDKYVNGICVCDAQKVVDVEENAKTVVRTEWLEQYMEVIEYYIVNYY